MSFHIHQRGAKQGIKPVEAGRPEGDAMMAPIRCKCRPWGKEKEVMKRPQMLSWMSGAIVF